ncbi:hypothetical protein H8R23_14485 [Flavobacterium sp. F-380]|uniref:Initiator Rep protein domain-containing protein n=1 Tax=Flavobacterium kayseriense TaxID=2764714 RepID=A0ABR7JB54_9FLAO|nr:hypothetical protein [Flavobacterium kayseriense]MBC5842618.1 hypothetical protein [Flavobacterium kayseriense]MBC5849148.1 hypothetical protein [Flavobacterium kayseriense]
MVHSRLERLHNIEKRLEVLTKSALQSQNQNTKDLIIDDEEFQYIMSLCPGGTRYWRDLNLIQYTQKDGKFFYTIEAVNKMLVEEFGTLKKKVEDNNHISVPIEMFIDAQKFGYQKDLCFFLFLKLTFTAGKVKLDQKGLLIIEFLLQIKCRKTSLKYIQLLLELKFLTYNERTGYYTINSFDKIRQFHDWKVRLAFPIDYNSYCKIKAVTGAVIYGYLHKYFWRKVKREKSVTVKGITYHFPSPTFNYKKQLAPVSVIYVSKFFKMSNATASRLKSAAYKEGFIKLKKNFDDINMDVSLLVQIHKYAGLNNNIVYHKDDYRLQLVDTVYPVFYFIKRTNLKT